MILRSWKNGHSKKVNLFINFYVKEKPSDKAPSFFSSYIWKGTSGTCSFLKDFG